jgi:hypothetical protein
MKYVATFTNGTYTKSFVDRLWLTILPKPEIILVEPEVVVIPPEQYIKWSEWDGAVRSKKEMEIFDPL